ncbi:hypothetical protein FB45DRAFT_389743 [Roridomyces roridus]|uniref:Uncharacterized protein n=1 Tax=Roridomyces roridus TaxID=1738132 RepID=A0AAD7B368_9AGAR|nr:hypothetical protein FB45DRAFT_389743 [Roridomyces roridus]
MPGLPRAWASPLAFLHGTNCICGVSLRSVLLEGLDFFVVTMVMSRKMGYVSSESEFHNYWTSSISVQQCITLTCSCMHLVPVYLSTPDNRPLWGSENAHLAPRTIED